MKIVVLDGYTENPGDLSWLGFERLGELTIYERTPQDKVVERIGNSEIAIINKTPITLDVIEKCPNLKYIGVLATGYNVVDIMAAKEKGIIVTNIPTYGSEAVGQATIALLLEICNKVGYHSNEVHKGRWQNNMDFCFWDYPLIELSGKTMGIIGYGRIGKVTARIAKSLGMNVIASSRTHKNNTNDSIRYVSLDELLNKSDVISLHCPLFKETEGIINRKNIEKMKDGVIILNTSRGGLVVEQDLAEALNKGKVYAAGLDVVSIEPIRKNNPLLKAKNCIITPHIAWAAKETRKRLMDIAVKNLESYVAGSPINIVV